MHCDDLNFLMSVFSLLWTKFIARRTANQNPTTVNILTNKMHLVKNNKTQITNAFHIKCQILHDFILCDLCFISFYLVHFVWGTRWRIWFRNCATSRKAAGSIRDGVIGIFSLTYSFRPYYGHGVDSASNRNEYQEYFLGVKAAGA